jgi:hypothetical protein
MNYGLTLYLLSLAIAVPQIAATKPNFTGTWKANWSKSKLQFQQPDSTVFTIIHREPDFSLSRTHTLQGKSDTWSVSLKTDGHEVIRNENGRTLRLRLKWEGDSLVFEVKIEKPDGDGSDAVRYSLSRDGKTFTALERYRDAGRSYDNVWVFDRMK